MAEAAFDGDLSSERFHQAAHEGEAQPGAFRRRIEAAEDGWQALRLNAAARVAYKKLNFIAAFLRFQTNGASIGSKANGVAHQIVEDGANGAPICAYVREVSEATDHDLDIALLRFVIESVERLLQDLDGA